MKVPSLILRLRCIRSKAAGSVSVAPGILGILLLTVRHVMAAEALPSASAGPDTASQIESAWVKVSRADLLQAAEGGNPEAQYQLATLQFKQADTIRRETFPWAVRAAGSKMESPKKEAVLAKWGNASEADVRRAAEAGDREAQHRLGDLGGERAVAEEQKGVEWLRRSARGGLCLAQNELGCYYRQGMRGVRPDLDQAVKLFREAAGRGFENAQHRLAEVLIQRNAAAGDLAEGIEWLRKAADQRCVQAQFDLAQEYTCGNGEPRDAGDTPVALYTKSAQAAHLNSQWALAERYRTGLGVSPDRVKAFVWYSLAAEQGQAQAIEQRDKLGTSLAEADRQRARAMLQDFHQATKRSAPGPL